jgi:hypothetical protein
MKRPWDVCSSGLTRGARRVTIRRLYFTLRRVHDRAYPRYVSPSFRLPPLKRALPLVVSCGEAQAGGRVRLFVCEEETGAVCTQ